MLTNFGLYLIITNPTLTYQEIARIAVKHNLRYLQLREKHLSDRELIAVSKEIMKITNNTKTKFIINDRADIAKIVDADGLHLGQDDISLADAKSIFGENKIYGLSTHSLQQAQKALAEKPDYIGYGPIFPTPTKVNPDPTVGLENIKQVVASSPLPVVHLGGIDESNVDDVINAGAKNVCLVRYLMECEDLEEKVVKIMSKFGR